MDRNPLIEYFKAAGQDAAPVAAPSPIQNMLDKIGGFRSELEGGPR